ncbi:MAG: glycoside hydrolase family 19 protein [Beijerinckiaceae bacterium]
MIDRPDFFAKIRRILFNGKLGVRQMQGISVILDRWESGAQSQDKRQLAYVLATVHHETARTFRPIHEIGGVEYLRRNYDITGDRPRLARANGNLEPGDGVRYAGRGFVQLTWKNNYRRVGEKLGIDLIAKPERAMELPVATEILVRGMHEGWFTGKALADFFNATDADWINARRIINGVDMARTIARYAMAYHTALKNEVSVATTAQPSAVAKPVRHGRNTTRLKPATNLSPRKDGRKPLRQNR